MDIAEIEKLARHVRDQERVQDPLGNLMASIHDIQLQAIIAQERAGGKSVPIWPYEALYLAATEIVKQEPFLISYTAPRSLSSATPKEIENYVAMLRLKSDFLARRSFHVSHIHDELKKLIPDLYSIPDGRSSPFRVPVMYLFRDFRQEVQRVCDIITGHELSKKGILSTLIHQVRMNLVRAEEPPRESKLAPPELLKTYLGGTPLEAFYKAGAPLPVSDDDRFSHMHIVGGTGAGKTTLIENLILGDIEPKRMMGSDGTIGPAPTSAYPSLVVIDPHGDLIQRLLHADIGIANRVIYINPRDIEYPPALNVFALNKDRFGKYDEATREQVTAGVIQTFDYLFSGLVGADLTAKQGVFFRYIARLMLSLPDTMGRNATILDMMNLMVDSGPYMEAIRALPDIPREFFLRDFPSKTFQQTREQIRYRLQSIIENPTVARLFTSPETKLDIFKELNRGAIILVDTAKDFLKGGSANFGRIFISLVLQAVLERSAIPANQRKDTFLIVDEAASYFDSNIDDLLTEARKYRCGCVFAHQYLDQASSSLRASLAANTAIKFASGLSSSDARSMAPEMRTTPDFILNQPK